MCNPNVQLRYTASMALKHPWILRKVDIGGDDDPIPMSMYEESIQRQINSELVKVTRGLFFACIELISVILIQT